MTFKGRELELMNKPDKTLEELKELQAIKRKFIDDHFVIVTVKGKT